MTIPEFVERLKTTDLPWVLNELTAIRAKGTCPLCAVAAIPGNHLMWWDVYKKLGLTRQDAQMVALAADACDAEQKYDRSLRQQLLAATVQR